MKGLVDPCGLLPLGLASRALERVLGAYLVDVSHLWFPQDGWDVDDLALEIDHPCVWTDGGAEATNLADVTVAGAGACLLALAAALQGSTWRWLRIMVMFIKTSAVCSCRSWSWSSSVSSESRILGTVLALQAFWPGHLGGG